MKTTISEKLDFKFIKNYSVMDSFIAIDFETSNYKGTGICSVGMVFVRGV
jgi:hypothetical protein